MNGKRVPGSEHDPELGLVGREGRRRESQATKRPRFQKGKRTNVAKMTGLYREEQLGEGRGYWLEFRVRVGLCQP